MRPFATAAIAVLVLGGLSSCSVSIGAGGGDAGGPVAEGSDVIGDADEGIEGVQSVRVGDNTHTEAEVDYTLRPPAGGAHNPTWVNCGFYDEAFPDEHIVHDLEHGAVWLAFADDLSADDVALLRELTRGKETVFHYKLSADNKELGTVERLANGRTLITELGAKPRLLEVAADGKIATEFPLQPETDHGHMQTRMARKLPSGNYLVPHLFAFAVKEYTPTGEVKQIFKTDVDELGGRKAENWPFTAIRLDNGNTLVNLTHGNKVVEFDATVPLDAHDKETPIVFLELVACAPDTREHESIVLTKAKASQIHAAMILIGLKPGTPGRIDATGPKIEFVPATGDAVTIELHWRDAGGIERRARPEDWIMNLRDSRALGTEPGRPGGWLFAGSRFVNVTDPATGLKAEVYAADPGGTIIGLTTFGTETIAWRETFSPDSGLSTPEWITRNDAVPPINTPMRVQVRPAAAAR
ncbi:MAG: YdjY domain-containing protein [Acidimicrobiales bacterium]